MGSGMRLISRGFLRVWLVLTFITGYSKLLRIVSLIKVALSIVADYTRGLKVKSIIATGHSVQGNNISCLGWKVK